jgi:glycyl-tRNA synthetase
MSSTGSRGDGTSSRAFTTGRISIWKPTWTIRDAYTEEEVNGESRVVLKLDPRLSPVKVAVLPLSKKPDLVETTNRVADSIRGNWQIEVDVTQSIGRRYRRQDEIGTPFCVTVDFDSLDDGQVTVRDRDTMQQDRISIDDRDTMQQDRISIDSLAAYLSDRLPR